MGALPLQVLQLPPPLPHRKSIVPGSQVSVLEQQPVQLLGPQTYGADVGPHDAAAARTTTSKARFIGPA
jgi:hypothetical protein